MQLLDIPKQIPSSEVDEEILEIFVEEVEEVLEEIVTSYQAWKSDPADLESLKVLRRNFHTLKGSGRLVGATIIGELGWRFENMLNRVIDGHLARNKDMLSLLEQVETVLPSMIEQFQNNQPPPDDILLLISQVDYFTQSKGQSLGDFELPTREDQECLEEQPISADQPVDSSPTIPQPLLEETETRLSTEATETTNHLSVASTSEVTETEASALEDLQTVDIPESNLTEILATDDLQLEVNNFSDSDLENFSEGDLDLELDNLSEADLELEISDFSTEELNLNEVNELPEEEAELDLNLPSAIQPEVDSSDLLSTTPVSDTTATPESSEIEAVDPIVFDIFKTEANQHLSNLKSAIKEIEETSSSIKIEQEIVRAFHSLNGSSRSVNFAVISEIAAPLEGYARTLLERQIELTSEMLGILKEATQLIDDLLNAKPVDEEQQQALLDNVQMSLESLPSLPSKTTKVSSSEVSSQAASTEEGVPDATDEFMAIFLDEAEEILENTQSLLERWQASPNNMPLMKELQRELHTLKGGARMVGIAPMGDLSHHLESVLTKIVEGTAQSNTKLQEIVQNSVDELAAMLEAVRASVPLEKPIDLIEQISAALTGDEPETAVSSTVKPSTTPAPTKSSLSTTQPAEEPSPENNKLLEKETELATDTGEDRIRVRVTLIDKLTNLAGELSISRAHMEQQQAAFKNNLVEMEQTVTRLRDQLRRLEIETEAQILSHFSITHSDEEEFDPLELDRFSAMQQLSRSLMESVSDLLNIQDFLKTLTRQSDALLIQQTRIGAELQEGIMRTRMIPFARISPRLQRIARLTARELRKQVDFIINGENIEFERTVLNRVVAPLEHMLRNAIGHGIEDAQTRQQAGKSTVAKITIDLSREGSELIIQLSDDGAGLNLSAIRQKAEERGLLKPDTVLSDKELVQFILEPAFSTAKTITQVSGRGVGMDVVNTEIKQLGGSLQIHSKTGEGTTFEIRLPLSLTITQALMVHIGEETMAIPMNNIEAVMRAPRQEVISEGDEVRYYNYMDRNYQVCHLGEILGFGKIASVDSSLIPMLLVRAADRRVALLVDGIEGSKEIVVKAVGAQISAIRWIAGATILGDGRVVLILDVPSLTLADTTEVTIQPPAIIEEVVEETTATKTIMVVDDSITVRKVTARLLKRQGMEVLTAKDGVDAVAQLQETVPDLMLLDVEMPRMDGYELATQVRNNQELKHIPIIMITSRTGAKHRDRAEKIGINRYLGKPFNETELLENINALLTEVIVNKSH